MSGINRHKPHVVILPEDVANHQIATGFKLDPEVSDRQMLILGVAGGWTKVLNEFTEIHAVLMRQLPNRYMILLIDFDGKPERREYFENQIPLPLKNRVFIIGSWLEAEDLSRQIALSRESVGTALARECSEDKNILWSHALLQHNAAELVRLRESIRPFLFLGN